MDKRFLFHLLQADSENIKAEGNGIAMSHATKGGMEQRKFPPPPLEVQHQVVAEIEGHQTSIEIHKKAIAAFEEQIKSSINKLWGS